MSESLKDSVGHLRQNIHLTLDRWLRRRTGTAGKETISTLVDGPPVDFEDKGDEVVVVAEIPNFDNENVSIEVRDDRLILRGEKKQESEERGDNYYRTARKPDCVHANNTTATWGGRRKGQREVQERISASGAAED
jgi:HSP20 family molecular chaperone IbpA